MILVMSSEVETSLDLSALEIIRDSSTALGMTMKGGKSFIEALKTQ
jgi:hypothetical protein